LACEHKVEQPHLKLNEEMFALYNFGLLILIIFC